MRSVLGGCLCACAFLAASADMARSEAATTVALLTEPLTVSDGSVSPPLFGRIPLPRIRPASAPRPPVPNSPQDVCNTIAATAQQHRLPIAFFGNLIYQESGLKPRIVSRAGARGIAQFMPKTARLVGLKNPFNPREALPASAKFLRGLLHRFGDNYGLAAAAYNAGPGRVSRWLKRGGGLPRETRKYVLTITGKRAEQWRGAHGNAFGHDLTRRIPCSNLKAFANLENNPASVDSLRPVVFVLPMPLPNPLRPAQQTAMAGGGHEEPQLTVNIEMRLPVTVEPAPSTPAVQAINATPSAIAIVVPPIPRPAPHRPEPGAIAAETRIQPVESDAAAAATNTDAAAKQVAMISPAENASARIVEHPPTPRPAPHRLADRTEHTGSINHTPATSHLKVAIKDAPLPRPHPHRIAAGRPAASTPHGKSIERPPLPRVHPLRMAQASRKK